MAITIPDSVKSIGESAFNGCSGLMAITIPDSVTSIGKSAFYGCSGLETITIPDNVTSVGDNAFFGCSSLICFNFLGNAPNTIGSSAFPSRAAIHVRPSSSGWGVEIPGTWNGMPIVYGLVFSASGSGDGGEIVGGGDFNEGETTILKAEPAEGYVFACWAGDLTGIDTEVELQMTRDWTATALFIPEAAADRLAVERAEKNGLYSKSQIQAMSAGDILLDVSEGVARIGVHLQENDDLSDTNGWHSVELSADAVDIGTDGTIGIRVSADEDIRFFRLVVP